MLRGILFFSKTRRSCAARLDCCLEESLKLVDAGISASEGRLSLGKGLDIIGIVVVRLLDAFSF